VRQLVCKLALLAAGLACGVGAAVPAGEGGTQRVTYTPAVTSSALPSADRIVVHKSERKLELLAKGEVLRSYKVALGLQPVGHKERSGDFRTPEGKYVLARRNPRSDFFLSIQISYPNDRTSATRRRTAGSPVDRS